MVSNHDLRLSVLLSTTILILMLILSACVKTQATVDPQQRITEIAGTVRAELTQVSALTPSVTPTVMRPTNTPTPLGVTSTLATSPTFAKTLSKSTSGDDAQYLSDVTIPDNSAILPGTTFTKTWSVTNTGTTTWTTDYKLLYLDGLQDADGALYANLTQTVAPGETVNVSVDFVAPSTLGSYSSYWTLYNSSGYYFGEQLSLKFMVANETATPTSTGATSTVSATETSSATATP